MRYYKGTTPLRHALPSTKIAVLGGLFALLGILSGRIWKALLLLQITVFGVDVFFGRLSKGSILAAVAMVVAAIIIRLKMSGAKKIQYMLQKYLYTEAYGNPLNFKEGEFLPEITVKQLNKEIGNFEITVKTTSRNTEELQKISMSMSSALRGRYENYAVVWTEADIAGKAVYYWIEDVTVRKKLFIDSVEGLRQADPTKLIVQRGTYIDLALSGGSMTIAGKTRSGKTSAFISLILQVLLFGPDDANSEVMIIDPKCAELSALPHVYSPDPSGNCLGIWKALQKFAETMKYRQQILNDLSKKRGDVVHWYEEEAGMKVSLLFLDEYISLRSMVPKKADKENPDFCLDSVDKLVRRIVTMGASAGCFVIISVPEASVGEAGLPTMIKNACATKIVMRPTPTEGRLMWEGDKIKDLPERSYLPGDAWLSSTDGKHDMISFVQFPFLRFGVYAELGRLLNEYYDARRRNSGASHRNCASAK